ncbi:MAG: hypothetical protein ACSHWZ_06945 [Sulfitobacter sp.]
MSLKVVNLGLPKTGTTSFARALKLAGLKVADHRIRANQSDDPALQKQFLGDLLYRGFYETGDPGAHLGGFDALSEISLLHEGRSIWPQMDFALITALRQHHPGLKFVATRRAAWDVSQSMLAWTDLGVERLPASNIPGLPEGYGETSRERIVWIEGHYAHLAAIFAGDDSYLELDVSADTARETLAAHLGLDLPWWGKANANKKIEVTS